MSNMTVSRINGALSNGDIGELMEKSRLVRDVPVEPKVETSSNEPSFSDMLKKGIEQVDQVQREADYAVKEAVAGRNKNLHETMLLMEKADMTYKFAMQVRNKILDAYREVMKMQV